MAVGPASLARPAPAGGLAMALVMHQHFRGKNLARAFLLLPFIVPTILSTVAWMWILDPTFSVVNWTLVKAGVMKAGPSWLGNASLAMVSIIVVNTWRGLPFYGITLLAGLQTIAPDLYEAAAIDGANARQRFRHVTLPIIKPVLIIVTMLDRKSTRLNSSHLVISYAVFCLKKKKNPAFIFGSRHWRTATHHGLSSKPTHPSLHA